MRRQYLHDRGVPVVSGPKNIDNDLSATGYTCGFDTSARSASEAIDQLQATDESHCCVLVVEVMARHSGWIAMHTASPAAPMGSLPLRCSST
jgi:6-phosphofructokinase